MFFQRMSSGGSSGNISVALQSLQRCVLCPVDMLLDSMEATCQQSNGAKHKAITILKAYACVSNCTQAPIPFVFGYFAKASVDVGLAHGPPKAHYSYI